MADQRIVLVTGATRGIGRAVAAGFAERGHTVVAGARAPGAGHELAVQLDHDSIAVTLDVTDPATIEIAATTIRRQFGRLDSLINNAGINLGWDRPPSETRLEDLRGVYEVDVFGVIAVTRAMLPLLALSRSPRIVNVSSPRGSLALSDRWVGPWSLAYGTAKTALNAITIHYSHELRHQGFAVTAVSPGHVATDLTRGNAPLTPEHGARQIIDTALAPNTSLDGTFIDENGQALPW